MEMNEHRQTETGMHAIKKRRKRNECNNKQMDTGLEAMTKGSMKKTKENGIDTHSLEEQTALRPWHLEAHSLLNTHLHSKLAPMLPREY